MKIKPKKWTEVYPVGTSEGNEESKFFRYLARNQRYEWRSTAALAKESGLSKKRVEEIVEKYYKLGMIFQHPKNEDHWAYWERVPEMLKDQYKPVFEKDKDERINSKIAK